MFNRLADLLGIEKANPFRVRAYRNAARTLSSLPRSVASMLKEGEDLSRLPGIGKDPAQKIAVIVETGRLPALGEIERHTPSGLIKLLSVPGLGPKRVRLLHESLGIEDVEALAAAARSGAFRRLTGFGPKTERNILHALETRGAEERRLKRIVAEALADYLRSVEGVMAGVEAVAARSLEPSPFERHQHAPAPMRCHFSVFGRRRRSEWFFVRGAEDSAGSSMPMSAPTCVSARSRHQCW
jgi:DNA polymerase/3'-5' exonuclease PolX